MGNFLSRQTLEGAEEFLCGPAEEELPAQDELRKGEFLFRNAEDRGNLGW